MRRFAMVAAIAVFTVTSLFARDLPTIDALAGKRVDPSARADVMARGQHLIKQGAPLHVEARLGVPTMVWAADSAAATAKIGTKRVDTSSTEVSARSFLAQYAQLYLLDQRDAADASLIFTHDTGSGPIVAKFNQRVEGIEIFREEINILMNQRRELVAIGGYISSPRTPAATPGGMSFRLDARNAAVNAYQNLTVLPFDASQLTFAGSRGDYEFYNLPASAMQVEPLRMKKVYFRLPEGLEPGYYIEIAVREEVPSVDGNVYSLDYYAYVISANDGRVLFRHNLTASDDAVAQDLRVRAKLQPRSDAPGTFTYRVWADPVSWIPYDTPAGNAVHPKVTPVPDGYQAPFVAANDVTLQNYPFSQNDPWLDLGATETVGNNADAYVDLFTADGYTNGGSVPPSEPATADFRAQITGAGQFLHTHTAGMSPSTVEPRQGSIQQLFYNVNFLHDWFYDAGFNEAARNAQQLNHGRGGVEGDRIRAEAQDFSGRNNANMATPADGVSPRMQMFVFDSGTKFIQVVSPAGIAATHNSGTGQFGTQQFDLTAQVSQPSPADGCSAGSFTGLAGRIVLVDREPTANCSIGTKLNNAMAAGAAGFILVNLSTTPTSVVNVTGSLPTFTIPFTSISWNGAAAMKTQLAASATVTARLFREFDRDGTIDNQIVFHEWGHYLSNRLIGNGSGLASNQSGGMGEGWGDFTAMLLTVRPDDTATPSNTTWNGAYALATYALSGGGDGGPNQSYYFGIRRMPYSTDMTRNSLTYRHIANGQPISGAPILYGADGADNAEVHNTGEVWAQMLWECYAALLRDTQGATPRLTFDEAQRRMKQYLVASLKMTPSVNPTFVEARDAVLAAAYATDLVDYVAFWQAFAKRGLGSGATPVANRDTGDNTGITESFATTPELVFDHAAINDSSLSCDNDGVLDSGETGLITIYLRNTGTTRLSGVTGTVGASTPGFSLPSGGALAFGDVDPLGTIAVSVPVAMATGMAGVQQGDFTLQFTHPSLANIPRNASFSFGTNWDVIPSSTATDTVESANLKWTRSASTTGHAMSFAPFTRTAVTPLQHVWHADNVGTTSDERLTSPVFTVDGSGSFNVQFDHSWHFEFDGGGNYDGGVIEMSVNGGAFVSIGGAAYTGTLRIYANNTNPLQGQSAFVGNSGGTVHTSLTNAVAPGSTVQVRFRAVSDGGIGAPGWNIDNIAFSGVVETPFDTRVSDTGCGALPNTTTALSSSANPSPAGMMVTLTATVTPDPGPGTVTFRDGGTVLGTGTVTAGSAFFSTSSLTMSEHDLTATFNGAAGFDPSTGSLRQTIGKAATTVAMVVTPNPTTAGTSVTFTATVSGSNGTPVGSVTFLNGASELASIALASGGVAAYASSSVPAGVHSITARYEGNTTTQASTSAVTTLTIAPPTPTATPGGPTTFCAGGSVTLTSSSATGNQWYLDGNPIGGATNQTYAATATGSYTVIVTEGGASSLASAAVVVTVNPIPPTPTVTLGGPTTFCTGGSVTLTSSSATGNQWYLDGNPIGGETNQTYVATGSGAYTVIVTSIGCSSAPSAGVTVTVNPIPAIPTITPGGPTTFCAGGSVTLTSSSATGNQWYLNGNPIGGETNQTYVATGSGDYSVVVTTSGCSSAPSIATTVTVNPNADATITAPSTALTGATGLVASVADAGAGATYAWSIVNGTITAGTGTNSITFTAGAVGTTALSVTVTPVAGCPDSETANVDVTALPPSVTVTSVSPNSGSSLGGTAVTITGSGFLPGATVTFGSAGAGSVVVVNATQITAVTPAHAAGAVNVTVTNTDTTSGALNNGFTYTQTNFDPNGDSSVDPADIFYLVAYLFTGGPAPAGVAGMPSGDANGDGAVNPADIFYAINYLFGGGPAPFVMAPGAPATNAIQGPFSGALDLGTPMRRGDRWFVPVVVTMDEGSPMPQALSISVRYTDAVSNAVFRRGQVAQPIFEISRGTGNAISYLVAFDEAKPLAGGASRSVVVAEIEVDASSMARLELDPALTMFIGARGAKATVASQSLRISGATIGRDTTEPRQPRLRDDSTINPGAQN